MTGDARFDPWMPQGERDAVSAARFRAIMERLGPWLPDEADAPPVALAVSGGGDSLALAFLASTWRRNLVAFVVDHGLRPEFEQEATCAFQLLSQLGIPARQLTVTGLLPGSALARRARDARYELLIEACRHVGAVDLLVAHQADDQSETVAMRSARAPSGLGLAGMAAITELPGLRLVRPLLSCSRQALRSTLLDAGLTWKDDPSNENEKAERVRVRKYLTDEERAAFFRRAVRAAETREKSEAALVEELATGGCRIFPAGWAALGETLPSVDALTALIRCIGGQAYSPSRSAVEALRTTARPATRGGTRLMRGKTGRGQPEEWLLLREADAMEGRVAAGCWDGRFVLGHGAVLPDGVTVGAAGRGIERGLRGGIPSAVVETFPALWRGARRLSVPHLGFFAEKGLENLMFDFVPAAPVSVSNRWMNVYLT